MKQTLICKLAALSCLTLALNVSWAADGTDDVPRSEYEELKREIAELRARLDTLVAPPRQAAAAAAEPSPSSPAPVAADTGAERRAGFVLDTSHFKPGWQRFRDNEWTWMGHGRYHEMNALIAQGDGFELFAGMTSAGRFQALQQRRVVTGTPPRSPGRLEPGFQTAWGSFEFLADFDRELEVYFDVYLSTKAHQNQLQGHEGYMLMRSLPDPIAEMPGFKQLMAVANVKAGQFDIDFGDHRYRRTDNARGQRNPFVGNTLIDPSSTEVGVEIFSKPTMVNWLVGVGSASETGSFDTGRSLGVHGKTWINFDQLRLSGSAYHVDHGTASAFSNLYRSSRSGGQYNGIFDNGNAPGNIFVGAGKRFTAYQGDVTWHAPNYELYGHLGWVKDKAPTGDESWIYYTVDGVYRLSPRLYGAARYNSAHAGTLRGVSSDGKVQRIQLGGGYWLFPSVLFKVEYVYESMSGFTEPEGRVSGVDAWRRPMFQGVISEFTFSY